MIEDVSKSVSIKKTVDYAFINKLYADMTSLYRLDQLESQQGTGAVGGDLGPLPAASRALLITLAAVWASIIVYLVRDFVKKKKAS